MLLVPETRSAQYVQLDPRPIRWRLQARRNALHVCLDSIQMRVRLRVPLVRLDRSQTLLPRQVPRCVHSAVRDYSPVILDKHVRCALLETSSTG